jgi:hypothetical protein
MSLGRRYDRWGCGLSIHKTGACAVTIMLALALSSNKAWANGRFPAANQLVVSPSNPDLFASEQPTACSSHMTMA